MTWEYDQYARVMLRNGLRIMHRVIHMYYT